MTRRVKQAKSSLSTAPSVWSRLKSLIVSRAVAPAPEAPPVERRRGGLPPIRMLHVITRLQRGGADERALETVRGLDRTRYAVDLVVGEGSDLDALSELDEVGVIVLPILARDPHPIRDLIALFRLARLIRQGPYQIVHAHTARAGFLGRLAAAMTGNAIVVRTPHGATLHEHLPFGQRWFYMTLERVVARFTRQLVAVGESSDPPSAGGPGAGETIYCGMPLDEYLEAARMGAEERNALRAELGLEPRHQVLAVAARLEARKGHIDLFRAVRKLAPRHPDLRVLVLGEGSMRAQLEWQTRALEIEDRVKFCGHRGDLARVLAAADIMVLTSLWEGLPRVLVQSAAAGRPLPNFDVESAWEVVRNGRNGFIVPTRDVEAFSARLEALLLDRARGRSRRRHWTLASLIASALLHRARGRYNDAARDRPGVRRMPPGLAFCTAQSAHEP